MSPSLHAIAYSFTRIAVIGLLIFSGFSTSDLFPSVYITIGAIVIVALVLDWMIGRFFKTVLRARCGNCQSAFQMYLGKREYNNGRKSREVKYRCYQCDVRVTSGVFVY